MLEIAAAFIGAAAVIGIPLAAWSSRRFTKEGRLLLRLERLGSAYALMPGSPEKKVFEKHLNHVAAELNQWLDEGNRKRRRIQRRISTVTYVIGIVVLLLSLPFTSPGDPWRSALLGIGIGVFISGVTLTTAYFLEKGAIREAERAEKEEEQTEQAARIEALRSGNPIHQAAQKQ